MLERRPELGLSHSLVSKRGQAFLFLQGPISPFFSLLAGKLASCGHRVSRINICFGDRLLWRRPGATNFRGKLKDWPAYIAAFLEREGITDLVLLGEQRSYQKAAIAAARQRGIRVTVTDFGYLRPDWITLEPDGMSGLSRFPRNPAAIRALAKRGPMPSMQVKYADSFFRQALWDVTYHLSNSLFRILYPHYESYQLHHPVLAYLGTALRLVLSSRRTAQANQLIERLKASGEPFFLFPMQMETDFSLRAYSTYPDMKVPIGEVIRSFALHAPDNAHLLVKTHPLDPGLRNWRSLVHRAAAAVGVDGRVHYIDGGSLGDILATAAGVVTINSTVGLWALRSARPVIALGTAIYDVDGLTFQGRLNDFWRNAAQPDDDLVSAFVTALANTIQIRGVYYAIPGLAAAVNTAAEKLDLANQQGIERAMSPTVQQRVSLTEAAARLTMGPLPAPVPMMK